MRNDQLNGKLNMTRRGFVGTVAAAGATVAGLGLAGCSGGGDTSGDGDTADTGDTSTSAVEAPDGLVRRQLRQRRVLHLRLAL